MLGCSWLTCPKSSRIGQGKNLEKEERKEMAATDAMIWSMVGLFLFPIVLTVVIVIGIVCWPPIQRFLDRLSERRYLFGISLSCLVAAPLQLTALLTIPPDQLYLPWLTSAAWFTVGVICLFSSGVFRKAPQNT